MKKTTRYSNGKKLSIFGRLLFLSMMIVVIATAVSFFHLVFTVFV